MCTDADAGGVCVGSLERIRLFSLLPHRYYSPGFLDLVLICSVILT